MSGPGRRVAVLATAALLAAGCDGSAPTTLPPPPTTVTTAPPPATTQPPPTTTTVRTPPTTTTAPPSPTTTAQLPEPVAGWERLPVDPELFGEVTVTAGAADGGRFVLTGCPRPYTAGGEFPVWWSADGDRWQRAEGPPDAGCLVQVEASPFGFYADAFGGGDLLHSPDGASWQPLDPVASLTLDPRSLGVVFAVFVAPDEDRVTLLYSRGAEAETRVATLVTTTDGETWHLGPAESAALFDSSDVGAVVRGGPGLVAVGASPGGEFVPTAAAFASPDGLTWTRVTPGGPDFDDKVMTDVLELDGGYVAVGGDFFVTGLMTAWTSPDGVSWTRSPHPDEETDPGVAHMTADAVTAVGGRIWAAGRDSDARRGNEPPLPALWVSDDGGASWGRADLEAARSSVPFEVIATPDLRVGVWPPPFSLTPGPVLVFASS